ncbi:MAG: hypothetical protein KDA53_04580 [Hyphomonas sp.]|nr:hypothetical protein [Hyphomonas sp.]
MTRHGITDERIFELIDAYGADAAAFPESEREAARRRLTEAPGLFAAALEEARALDGMLSDLPEPEMSPALRTAIMAAAPRAPRTAGGTFRALMGRLPNWVPAGAVASLAMGLVIGANVSLPASASVAAEDADSVMYAAFGFDELPLLDEETE